MQVASLGPLPVASLWWRRGAGPWTITVACKATLELLPGEARLLNHPEPLHERERFPADDLGSSAWAPADLSPDKPFVDVTLVGDAFPPPDHATDTLPVTLRVGDLDKSLQVQLEWSDASGAFKSTPLGYEQAAGGAGTDNPVGMPAASGMRPRISLPQGRSQGGHATAGFGPIASHWPGRQRLLRQGREPAEPADGGEIVVADDFDMAYFNAAPPDQQLRSLAPQAPITLYNLHPRHPVLETRLPLLVPQVFVERSDAKLEERGMQVDGLWIDTRRALATLTWRAHVALRRRDEEGRVWVVVGTGGKRIGFAELSDLVAAMGEAALERRLAATRPARRDRDRGAQRARRAEPVLEGEEDRLARTQSLPAAGRALRAHAAEHTMTASFPHGPGARDEQTSENEAAVAARHAASGPVYGASGPAWLRPGATAPRPSASGTLGTPFVMPPPQAPRARAAPPLGTPVVESDASVDSARAWADAPPLGPAPSLAQAKGPHEPPSWAPSPVPPPAPAVALAAPVSVRAGGRSPWSSGATGAARDAGLDEAVPEGGEPQVSRSAARAPRSDEVVELLWFDPDTTARLRLRWPALCDALEFAPLDPRHDLPNPDPEAARARHLHFGVLTEAEQTDPRGLTAALREAVSDTGRFTAPLIALGGELELPFDELETLRATAAALGPLASEDKKLKDAIASANEIADSPVLKGSPEVVRNFIGHLRKLYREAKRSFPQDYLDECVDRMLLSERRYQKKTVFGGECIRALLTPGAATSATLGTREPVPTYLPVALEKQLPLMKSFRARLVVEGHFKQDQYEAHACALRAISLGRVLAFG